MQNVYKASVFNLKSSVNMNILTSIVFALIALKGM